MRSTITAAGLFLLSLLVLPVGRPTADEIVDGVQILDRAHYSRVMDETRNFRIFLPPDYDTDTDRRYPVIYYFHGWSQRYFGITRSGGYDKGDDNDGDNIANYVAGHDVSS